MALLFFKPYGCARGCYFAGFTFFTTLLLWTLLLPSFWIEFAKNYCSSAICNFAIYFFVTLSTFTGTVVVY